VLKRINVISSRLARDACASEVAEAALVLLLMFMMLLGIFWFGQAFSIYGTITHAAREGARAAVAPACATCGGTNDPSQNAYNAIKSALLAAKLNPDKMQMPVPPPRLCICGSSNTSRTGGGAGRGGKGTTNSFFRGGGSNTKKKGPPAHGT